MATETTSLAFASAGVFQSLELKGHQEGVSNSVSNLKEQRKHRNQRQLLSRNNAFVFQKTALSLVDILPFDGQSSPVSTHEQKEQRRET